MSSEPKPQPYVAARVSAFNRANSLVPLCTECRLTLVKSPRPPRAASAAPGWCALCGREGTTVMGSPLPRGRSPRRVRKGTPAVRTAARDVTCPACGDVVTGDKFVVIQADQRVAHVRCVQPVCPECAQPIGPDHRVGRDGAALVHLACLLSRRRIAGGAGAAGRLLEELRGLSPEAGGQARAARALQAWARRVRGGRPPAAA
jgi:hypothetical protein